MKWNCKAQFSKLIFFIDDIKLFMNILVSPYLEDFWKSKRHRVQETGS